MKKALNLIIIISILFLLSSCATVFKGTSEEVNFQSDPQNAEVWVNGQKMGETPLKLKLESKKAYTIELRKEGYAPVVQIITNQINSGWVILGVLSGLVPAIVDSSTGALYSLEQKNIDAVLKKQKPLSQN